ncbi:MAG: inositol monophosphatase [Lentisphaeria bacterium]|nr:inositol monophosphatase [Lentisphaeria bacterium]
MIEFLKQLARQAGAIARSDGLRLRTENIHTKATAMDLVTDTDRKVEQFLITELKRRFPEYGIFGEETGRESGDRKYCFVIDPIDGTASFIHGLPNWCVSVGLTCGGRSVAGVIYQPETDDLYCAEEGGGSYVNGLRMHVSGRTELSDCIVATGLACLRARWQEENNLKFIARIAPELSDLRKFGSAALDCCLTARGAVDGYWELFLQPYDIAAGVIIAREAGAVITDLFGADGYPGRGFLCTNGRIHEKLLAFFHDFQNLKR